MKKLFLALALSLATIALSAEKRSSQKEDVLRYEDYGAVGDGVHDDMDAIVAAHSAANKVGRPVRIDGEKTYYIGPEGKTAYITTSVDFGKAKFIIDDTETQAFSKPIFIVKASQDPKRIFGVKSLSVGATKLGARPEEFSLVEVENANRKIYIRKGRNANNGTACHEVLLVDTKGNIDKSTPPHFEYDRVTKVTAYPIDRETLVIKGGEFLTKAVTWTPTLPYCNRVIAIRRSNVVIDGITHYVEGETVEGGAPYAGFVNIAHAYNVVVKNCVFTPHLIYRFPKNGAPFTRGTYDIGVNASIDTKFLDCSQTIDIDDRRYWGVMGTNFCRNTYLEGCTFSRYDNHMGVHNLTVKNCTFGYMSIQSNGFGKMYVEGCTMRRQAFINLRADYGSSWQGDIEIKNCKLVLVDPKNNAAYIINGANDATHDFGYDCYLPKKLTVDGLYIDDSLLAKTKGYKGPFVYAPYEIKGDLKPIVRPELVILKDVTVASGKPLRIAPIPSLYKDTVVETKNCEFEK